MYRPHTHIYQYTGWHMCITKYQYRFIQCCNWTTDSKMACNIQCVSLLQKESHKFRFQNVSFHFKLAMKDYLGTRVLHFPPTQQHAQSTAEPKPKLSLSQMFAFMTQMHALMITQPIERQHLNITHEKRKRNPQMISACKPPSQFSQQFWLTTPSDSSLWEESEDIKRGQKKRQRMAVFFLSCVGGGCP